MDEMSDIEHAPERITVLMAGITPHAPLAASEPDMQRPGEVGYVRADLHEGAVKALEAYGRHASNCAIRGELRCTCGWEATLAHFQGGQSAERVRCAACDIELNEARAANAAGAAADHDGLLLCGACRDAEVLRRLVLRARGYVADHVTAHPADQVAAQLWADIDETLPVVEGQ